jgi:RNA polymerase sigma factor (TIGR02999 family)
VTSTPTADQISLILADLRRGDNAAAGRLVQAVYPEMRRIAQQYLRSERTDHTLQATALVHEIYARLLLGEQRADWKNRAHFFAAIATEMRRFLVDYARARNAQKRPGNCIAVQLSEIGDLAARPDEDLVALDDALTRFERVDARASRVVELRFFTGLSERETAEALGISLSTLKRDWTYAQAWLLDALQ